MAKIEFRDGKKIISKVGARHAGKVKNKIQDAYTVETPVKKNANHERKSYGSLPFEIDDNNSEVANNE